jgi:hypothetical protein
LGEALGGECQAEDIFVILGPAVNIKRSLCGRNAEIDTKRRRREFMEWPLRYIYMRTKVSYEEIVRLVGAFNGLTN